MITELLIEAVLSTLAFLIDLLPADTIDWPNVGDGAGTFVGNAVGPVNSIFPVEEAVATFVLTVTVVMPAALVYRVALWLWALVPVVGSG